MAETSVPFVDLKAQYAAIREDVLAAAVAIGELLGAPAYAMAGKA